MAHVILAAQQAYQMKMAIAQMDCNTAYMVIDFKQKFLAKGFREGGDSYYGKKECCGGELGCMKRRTHCKIPGVMTPLWR